MNSSRILPTSRRGFLAAGGALGAGALLTACGSGSGSSPDDGAAADTTDAWTFTDDRGETASADSVPSTIVAFVGSAAVLHDFGIECAGVFGPTVRGDGEPDVQAGDIDVDKVTVLGNAWGEFNVEEYVLLEPDLLVTNMFDPQSLWYVPEDSAEKILAQAPSVGIGVASTTLTAPIQRYAELAESLGADLSAGPVTEARQRFEEASENLRRAARDNPGITVLAASASTDLFYASDPAASADLTYFTELGVDIITPEDVEGGYFESLSWENADRYDADVILLDNRSSALQPSDLGDKPTWGRLAAVEAGQIVPWHSEPRYSWAGCAPLLEELAEAIRDARKVS